MISFEDFQKIEIKIAKILAVEEVPGSEKLLKLEVSIGFDNVAGAVGKKQIIAGIKKSYAIETLVGKQIAIVANLESRTLMGFESQGMVLAAGSEEGPILLVPDKKVEAGATVK